MKKAFNDKLHDYKLTAQDNSRISSDLDPKQNDINPKEFVLGDSKSMISDDNFAEKEKPVYSESDDRDEKRSAGIESFTVKDEKSELDMDEPEGKHISNLLNYL